MLGKKVCMLGMRVCPYCRGDVVQVGCRGCGFVWGMGEDGWWRLMRFKDGGSGLNMWLFVDEGLMVVKDMGEG